MICSRGEVLTFLGLTGAGADKLALVSLLHTFAEGRVKRFVRYNVELKTHTEYFPVPQSIRSDRLIDEYEGSPGYSTDVLQLGNLPIRSITSVHENASAWQSVPSLWPSSTLLDPGGYYLDVTEGDVSSSGHLLSARGSWSNYPRSIRVIYQAGYTPEELATEHTAFKFATLHALSKYYGEALANMTSDKQQGVGAVSSERFADWNVTYAQAATNLGLTMDLPRSAVFMLSPYVRMEYR